MPDNPTLERDELLARAERARDRLLAAISLIPAATFTDDLPAHWSPGRILRHVAWTEHFWTFVLEHACAVEGPLVVIDKGIARQFAVQSSRLTGSPEEPLPAPPPYATPGEAIAGLAASRTRFVAAVRVSHPDDERKRISSPATDTLSLAYAPEHIIEHDWEHALELVRVTALS